MDVEWQKLINGAVTRVLYIQDLVLICGWVYFLQSKLRSPNSFLKRSQLDLTRSARKPGNSFGHRHVLADLP